MSRYKTIKGIRYSKELLNLADEASGPDKKQPIKLDTVKKFIQVLKSDNRYSSLEKRTIGYIRANFDFTDEANTYMRSEVRSWTGIELSDSSSTTHPTTTSSAPSETDSKDTDTSNTQQFTEFVNEETGEVYSTILEWGKSLTKSWSGIEDYLYEYPGCKYLTE